MVEIEHAVDHRGPPGFGVRDHIADGECVLVEESDDIRLHEHSTQNAVSADYSETGDFPKMPCNSIYYKWNRIPWAPFGPKWAALAALFGA
ncbi:hypothetical protein DLREEDagr8_05880 [Dongia sp. agr-C8]